MPNIAIQAIYYFLKTISSGSFQASTKRGLPRIVVTKAFLEQRSIGMQFVYGGLRLGVQVLRCCKVLVYLGPQAYAQGLNWKPIAKTI
ncbi:hypothetical protein AgCh_004089 [Apium graveolens]